MKSGSTYKPDRERRRRRQLGKPRDEILAKLKARTKRDPIKRIYELGLEAGMLLQRKDSESMEALRRNAAQARKLGVTIDF